jgi:hypothetical protein
MNDDLRVRRLPEKQVTDRAVLEALLDEALVAHVGVVRGGRPVVLRSPVRATATTCCCTGRREPVPSGWRPGSRSA